MVMRSPRVASETRQSVPSGRSRTSSLKKGPTVEKGVSSGMERRQAPEPKYTIQLMRVRGLNRALAVVAIVALAACSKTSEQAETSAERAVTFNEIAPILFDNCASCHRPIEDAPQAAATSDLASPKPLAEAGSADDPICVAGAPFS